MLGLSGHKRSYAQTFKFNLSPRHLAKIEKGKSAQQKLKAYRKFMHKDSARHLRKLNKYWQKKWDSIARVTVKKEKLARLAKKSGLKLPIDTTGLLHQYAALLPNDSTSKEDVLKMGEKAMEKLPQAQKQEVEELKRKFGAQSSEVKLFFTALHAKDSASKKKLTKEGLNQAKEKALASMPPAQRKQLEQLQSQYGSYSKEVSGYLGYLQDSVKWRDTLKVVASQKLESMANELATQQVGGQLDEVNAAQKELEQIKDTQLDYQKKATEYQNVEKLKTDGKAKLKQEGLERSLLYASKFKSVTEQMGKLKGKYSSLLNSDDLSTGVKEKSLAGTPLRDRWIFGGNFNIENTAPLLIDISPMFGYKIDKKLQVGFTGVFRSSFTDSARVVQYSFSPKRIGYGAFISYNLILNFFGYAEFERTRILVKNPDGSHQQWVNSLLVGVGRKLTLHPKLKGTVLFLWNPLHKNGLSPYHDAFVIKTGFQLSELGLLKK